MPELRPTREGLAQDHQKMPRCVQIGVFVDGDLRCGVRAICHGNVVDAAALGDGFPRLWVMW
jgi:hypothetical protein